MMKLDPYVNFLGKTEEAFEFYQSIFGGDFVMLQRYKDVKDLPDKEMMSPEDLEKIMHVSLKIGDNTLMGTDVLESAGHTLTVGDNISLSLSPDSKAEADRIFDALGEGGKIVMPMADMFWGAYYGMVDDRFGVKWMINFVKQ